MPNDRDVLITGSREILAEGLNAVVDVMEWIYVSEMSLVVGEAPGVDQQAIKWALQKHKTLKYHLSQEDLKEWAYHFIEVHGARGFMRLKGPGRNIPNTGSYPNRNTIMVDRVKPEGLVVAFWNGTSRGTLDTITKAKKRGLNVYVKEFRNE